MPYSKSLGAIFVAIPKTGTTSITRVLKTIQKSQDGKLSLLNERITPGYRLKHGLYKTGTITKPGRGKHLSAAQIKCILGDEEFDRCFKFTVVRNPWAWMVTCYFYTHVHNEPSAEEKKRRGTTRKFHDLSFEAWTERHWRRLRRLNKFLSRTYPKGSQLSNLVDADGNLLVDYIGRLETIQQSLNDICDGMGVDQRKMPHVNTSGKRPHYSSYYNQRTMEMVREICHQDIQYFGFDFETR
jgi:hypothetical protein